MQLSLQDINSEIFISDEIFGSVFNESLVHQVITSYQSNSRQGTRAQKSRSEVSGSGRKPWRQKGTGRARSGSIRSPIWRSGGVTFAAKTKFYKKKINKKMYRGALKSIFSALIRQNRLILVSKFDIQELKTRVLVDKLKDINLKNDVLIIINEMDKNLFLASRNLYKVKVCHIHDLNPLILIAFNSVIMTVSSIKSMEDILI